MLKSDDITRFNNICISVRLRFGWYLCAECVQELAEDCLSLCDGGAGLGLEKEPEALELAAILRYRVLTTIVNINYTY
jgi:hypothetical protein